MDKYVKVPKGDMDVKLPGGAEPGEQVRKAKAGKGTDGVGKVIHNILGK